MALPGRAYYTLREAAARWGCTPRDIVEWSTLGHLNLVAWVPMVQAGGEPMIGVVEIHPEECLPSMERDGTGSHRCQIYRMRTIGAKEWKIVDSGEPVILEYNAVQITASEHAKFEFDNILEKQRRAPDERYDWDAIYQFICARLFQDGLPESFAELIREIQDWYQRRPDGMQVPDTSTIRKRIQPLWHTLTAAP